MLDSTHRRGCLSQSLSLLSASRREHHGLAARSPWFLAARLTYPVGIRVAGSYVYPATVCVLPVKRKAGVKIQPSDAFKKVRVPQPSHAQPRSSSWRNRFAASSVSHGLRHLASVGKSPPLRLTSSRSRERAYPGTATSTPPGLAFQTCSSNFTPMRAGYVGWAYRT